MAAAADATRIGGRAARWMILGEWRAHPGRVIVAMIAIAVGVALGFAVHLINASALNEFARAVASVNGAADLQVRAKSPLGFDETLYPKLAKLDGIASASPVVELRAVADIAGGKSLTLLGLDMFRVATATPSLIVRASNATKDDESLRTARRRPAAKPFASNSLFLSQAALDATGKRIGDTIELTAAGRTIPFVISGTLPAVEEDQSIAVMDIADAQWRFDALGRLHRVDLKLAPGIDAARMRTAIAALLPSDAELVSQETEARRTDSLSRAYRVNLDMLALMALLTGAFLVYSAQSLSVARRRAQFALLRVLGVYRRGLIAQVLTEGAIVGAVGAIVGPRDRARSRRCGPAPPGRRSRRRLFQRHAPAADIRAVGGADVLRARRRRGARGQSAPRTRSRARPTRDRAQGRRRCRRSESAAACAACHRLALGRNGRRLPARDRRAAAVRLSLDRAAARRWHRRDAAARAAAADAAAALRTPLRVGRSRAETAVGRAVAGRHRARRHRREHEPDDRHGGDGVELPRLGG